MTASFRRATLRHWRRRWAASSPIRASPRTCGRSALCASRCSGRRASGARCASWCSACCRRGRRRAETIGVRFRNSAMSLETSAECALAGAAPLRLTSFSHGGGCGCKIAPGVLTEILRSSVGGIVPKELMVGIETADDAAVYRLNDEQALIATTDFFMPIVDDPYDFGRIAATNAISDVYAMGGKPIMALALVAMPINQLPLEAIGQIIKGGEAICREAGIPIAGGHTIDSVEPIYGLVVMGLDRKSVV